MSQTSVIYSAPQLGKTAKGCNRAVVANKLGPQLLSEWLNLLLPPKFMLKKRISKTSNLATWRLGVRDGPI